MYPKPKFKKGAKKRENEKRKRNLSAYRKTQYDLALERDQGGCRICEKVRADDRHHVFGRGRAAGDWQEHYTNLVFVCRTCHPLPIKTLPPRDDQVWIVDLLDEINTEPRRVPNQ